MSTWPVPIILDCPICKKPILCSITKRGAAPTCPGPAQEFEGDHVCGLMGWEVKIIGRKMTTTLPQGKDLEFPEGKLFPEPIIFHARKMRFPINFSPTGRKALLEETYKKLKEKKP